MGTEPLRRPGRYGKDRDGVSARWRSRATRNAEPVPCRFKAAVQLDGSRAFRQRDLDPNASAYIVEWAEETPADQSLSLVLHLGDSALTEAEAAIIRQSVGEYFRLRALAKRRQLQEMFRIGSLQPVDRAGVPSATVIVLVESLASLVRRASAMRLVDRERPGDRVVGRAVAAAGDFPVRLVADRREGEAVRPAQRDAGAYRQRVPATASVAAPTDTRHEHRATACTGTPRGFAASAALWRGIAFFLLWLLLMQSLKPGRSRGWLALLRGHVGQPAPDAALFRCLHFARLIALLPHFYGIGAGRRRRGTPRVPSADAAQPRVRHCPLSFPPGFARNTFATITSLLPGSVSAG
jgi:hypothetical protein